MSSIPVLLLAAGLGSRLRPLTDSIPKCLVPILGRPLLDYWLELCVEAGMGPIYINTHHHAHAIQDFIRTSNYGQTVTLLHEPMLLGTGGTLLANQHLFQNGTFFVAHADNLTCFSMNEFFKAHNGRPEGCLLTMMLFHTPTPQSCGIVELDDRNRVSAFYEKVPNPPGNLANGAVFFMEPEVFPPLAACTRPEPDISLDLLPQCLGRMYSFVNNCYHRDIGTPQSYAAAQKEFAGVRK